MSVIERKKLGPLLRRPPRYGIGAAAVAFHPSLPAYLRITDIDDSGRFAPSPVVSVDSPLAGSYILNAGEVVVARTGASVGKSYRYRPDDGELVFAGFLIALAPDESRLDSRFIGQYFQSKQYWDWVKTESTRSGQPGINAQQLASMSIDIPPVDIQRKIADRLEAADDLIVALERLIAKKQAIKQGLMQQILTGKTRLPGFDAPWASTVIGSVGSLIKGRGVKRDDVRPSGVPCIRYGELYTTFHNYTSVTVSFVSNDVAATALPIVEGDLLFAGSGETKAEIGTCVAYVGSSAAVAGGDIIVLRAPKVNAIFLASLLNTPEIAAMKASSGQGDAVVHINARAIGALRVDLPEKSEQDAISRVIVDADQELEALVTRLVAVRNIKQGMMQELLTGHTRLMPTVAAA